MYALPPSRSAADHAARYGPRVAAACAARRVDPLEVATYTLFVPPGLDPAERTAFWSAVLVEMAGTGWGLTVASDGTHAFPEPT